MPTNRKASSDAPKRVTRSQTAATRDAATPADIPTAASATFGSSSRSVRAPQRPLGSSKKKASTPKRSKATCSAKKAISNERQAVKGPKGSKARITCYNRQGVETSSSQEQRRLPLKKRIRGGLTYSTSSIRQKKLRFNSATDTSSHHYYEDEEENNEDFNVEIEGEYESEYENQHEEEEQEGQEKDEEFAGEGQYERATNDGQRPFSATALGRNGRYYTIREDPVADFQTVRYRGSRGSSSTSCGVNISREEVAVDALMDLRQPNREIPYYQEQPTFQHQVLGYDYDPSRSRQGSYRQRQLSYKGPLYHDHQLSYEGLHHDHERQPYDDQQSWNHQRRQDLRRQKEQHDRDYLRDQARLSHDHEYIHPQQPYPQHTLYSNSSRSGSSSSRSSYPTPYSQLPASQNAGPLSMPNSQARSISREFQPSGMAWGESGQGFRYSRSSQHPWSRDRAHIYPPLADEDATGIRSALSPALRSHTIQPLETDLQIALQLPPLHLDAPAPEQLSPTVDISPSQETVVTGQTMPADVQAEEEGEVAADEQASNASTEQ